MSAAPSVGVFSRKELNALTYAVIGRAINVHRNVGPGLLESVYKSALLDELLRAGMKVEAERPLPVIYEGNRIDCGYRLDLIVNDVLIIEVKSIECFAPIHLAQTLTYLRLSGLPLALLINFKVRVLKSGIKRVINDRVQFAPDDDVSERAV
jgi:GxxExxY protein